MKVKFQNNLANIFLCEGNVDNAISEFRKALMLMAKEEKDASMVVRINEALDYVQKVQLYYRTLSVNKRSSSI